MHLTVEIANNYVCIKKGPHNNQGTIRPAFYIGADGSLQRDCTNSYTKKKAESISRAIKFLSLLLDSLDETPSVKTSLDVFVDYVKDSS